MGKRILMIGAHPDDADIRFGGTAIKLVKAGHTVKLVSMCNGNCGHQTMSGKELAERRYAEAQASKAFSGVSQNQHTDINTYIEGLPSARVALRTAKNNHYTDADWLKLVEIIKQKK